MFHVKHRLQHRAFIPPADRVAAPSGVSCFAISAEHSPARTFRGDSASMRPAHTYRVPRSVHIGRLEQRTAIGRIDAGRFISWPAIKRNPAEQHSQSGRSAGLGKAETLLAVSNDHPATFARSALS